MLNTAFQHPDDLGFPFGRPLAACEPEITEPRPVLVLGDHARPLSVRWTPPFEPPVSLPVDTEPVPFWDGLDADLCVRRWRREAGFVREWGSVEPDPANGADGRWLAAHVLAPLGLAAADAWGAYAIPYVALPHAALRTVDDAFWEFSRAAGLPPRKPYAFVRGRRAALRTAHDQAARLDDLFARADPELVVTVGSFAEWVFFGYAVNLAVDRGEALESSHDGPLVTVRIGERRLRWVALSRHDRTALTRRVMADASLRLG